MFAMLPNKKEKEALIIDLLKREQTVRDIAGQAHVSFSDVKKIRMKLNGRENEEDLQRKKPLSIPSQAFKLFLDGKSLIQVAIWLDLPTDRP
jgi:hypothetical protein